MPWCNLEDGRRLWYEDQGEGPPLVLLHGWCMSSAVWRFQFETLGRTFRLIAPDLRGHGQSETSPEGYDFAGFSADVHELFLHLDVRDVLLAGWSLGVQVALLACARLRERLSGLALISGTPRFTSSDDFSHGLNAIEIAGMSVKVRRNPAKALEGFMADMFSNGERNDRDLDERIRLLLALIPLPDKQVAVQSLKALAEADMRGLLPTIDLPTLIINGDQDRICLPDASVYMARRIPASAHIVLSDCGHAPFLTHCNEFNDAITSFSRSIFEQGR
jgi:pimeloyl-ACP methyl ester esterase